MHASSASTSELRFFIVTATYNRASLVRRAIESVLAQSFDAWDLYALDDGSSDDTRAVLANLPDDPRIHHWHFDQNRGANAARNFLLERILDRNEPGFIAILDDDDILTKDALAQFAAAARRNPDQRWFIANCHTPEGHSLTNIARYGKPICYLRDHKFGNAMAGEVAHVFHTSIVGGARFTERIRNAEEWWFFSDLARRAQMFPLDFHATTMVLLEDGLSLGGGNRDRALEIYELKVERYARQLSRRHRAQLETKLARHMLLAGQTGPGLGMLLRNLARWPFEPRIYAYFGEFVMRSLGRG